MRGRTPYMKKKEPGRTAKEGTDKEKTRLRLSKRMQAVADMVTEGNRVCDIGCDHGFVSIYLIREGISPGAIAMDVNEGPLQAAGEHIGEFGLENYIETRQSDGMEALAAGEADTLICAGMGGRLIKKIMEEGKEKALDMKELVLQPQSEIQALREYLREEGYLIADENIIFEEGKYYFIIKALPGKTDELAGRNAQIQGTDRQRVEDKYGPVLLKKKNPLLEAYLQRESALCMRIMENLHANGKRKVKRQEEITDRIKDIETALSYYKS